MKTAISMSGGKKSERAFVAMWKVGCSITHGIKNKQNAHNNELNAMMILWDERRIKQDAYISNGSTEAKDAPVRLRK